MTVATMPDTRTRIVASAQRLVQMRGFNGMSYADIAAELGITKAALHYHFPTKTDLGLAAVDRYAGDFAAALRVIDESTPRGKDRLRAYASLYVAALEGERLCLCAMLAAEQRTLTPAVRRAVEGFFAANVRWLADVVRLGRRDGSLGGVGPPDAVAHMLLGAFEGAMLVAWSRGDLPGFRRTARQLVESVAPAR